MYSSQSSTSYSYSSSSGGGVGTGALHSGAGMSGMSMSGGGGGVSAGSVAFARKTNVTRTSAAASGSSMMMALSALGGGTATYAGSHELATNPTAVITRRTREKNDIHDLNVKLAEYIESNGWYRIKVKEQEKLILKMKGEFESIEARLRGIYDVEMANLRATIDATAKEKAAVELKVDTLETLYKDFRVKYEAELSAHESTRARLPKLEKEISEKDAQIDFLAKTLSSLEPQVSALKSQISSYQKETIDAKMGADAEIVRRVELESKLVTKEDEIAFLKKVYEEKLRMALDFDFDSDAAYNNDLAEALKDIRAEYQAQLEAIRGDSDDSWFQQKFNAMMQTSEKQRGELEMARAEISKSKTRYTELMTSNSTLGAQISTLQAAIVELNASIENDKKLHAVAISDRDSQIIEYKRQIASHILELKSLMDIKLSLDAEIGTYRRLLLSGGTTVTGGGTSIISGGGGAVISGGGGAVISGGGGMVSSGSASSMTSTTTTSFGFGAQVSASERAYYERIFREFAGADGVVNGSELKQMFDRFDAVAFASRGKRNATQQYCGSLMSSADSDGSGQLSFDEFLRLMIFEKKIFLKNAFKASDVGGKGFLTQVEVLNGLAAAGYEVDDNIRAAVASAISGADGKINFNEFVMSF